MSSATLITHAGARKVTEDELSGIVTPPQMGPRHKPVPHIEVVKALQKGLSQKGLAITRAEYAVGERDGEYVDTTLFGVFDVAPFVAGETPTMAPDATQGFAMGFRSNNTMKRALRVVAGQRVFVCDNLTLAGDEIVMRKLHTLNLDLESEALSSIDRFIQATQNLKAETTRFHNQIIPLLAVKQVMYEFFVEKVLPLKMMPKVDQILFHPTAEMTDIQDFNHDDMRSLWNIHNAVTRVLREEPLHRQMELSRATTRKLEAVLRQIETEN